MTHQLGTTTGGFDVPAGTKRPAARAVGASARDTSADGFPARFIAVDIGGTKIASAVATLPTPIDFETPALPQLSNHHSVSTPSQDGARAVVSAVIEAIKLAQGGLENDEDAAGENDPELAGIAIASAGVVDTKAGKIVSATDLIKGWAGTELAREIEEEFGLPVTVLNDVHAHGLGESTFGAARDYDSVLAVAVGTGIGGALIFGGEVHMGAHFAAGHVGHVPHGLARGMKCSCGAYGHLESVASGTGQVALYNARRTDSDPAVASGQELTDHAARGESLALATLVDSGSALGDCMAGVANCVDPEAIVLSGSVTRSGHDWWQALRKSFQEGALPALRDIPILNGELGGDAPLLGAVVAAINAMNEDQANA